MRRTTALLIPTFALALACTVSSAPPTETPTDTTAPTTPAADAPTTVADPTISAEQAKKDEEAKKKAEQEKKIAARLAQLEKDAAAKKERWTPELSAEVERLVSKTHRNLDAGLAKILPSEHRTPGASERDTYRHPKETLKFFGLKPNMKVFEVGQGAGWYTEILAPLLAKNGTLYLAGYDSTSNDPLVKLNARQAELFVEGGGPVYSKIELVTQSSESDAPVNFGPPDSLDMIIVVRMLHNIHRGKVWDKMMPAALAALKPGGVLAVVQHRAADGSNPDETAPKGYLAQDWLTTKITGYGFELAGKSEVNANPKDTKDYDKGVWALPPVLAEGDKDKAKYLEIGESDRATLKFVKPAKARIKAPTKAAAAPKAAKAPTKAAAAPKAAKAPAAAK
jgi:predicted methyltransferase